MTEASETTPAFISQAEAEQIWDTLASLADSATAVESLLTDVFQTLASHDPTAVACLRDQAAACAQRAIDRKDRTEADQRLMAMWHIRWTVLNKAMTAAGYPYEGAEVVDIAEHPDHKPRTSNDDDPR